MTEHKDIVLKTGLTADQYLHSRDMAASLGLSQSGYLRYLVAQDMRSVSLTKLYSERMNDASTEMVQIQDRRRAV